MLVHWRFIVGTSFKVRLNGIIIALGELSRAFKFTAWVDAACAVETILSHDLTRRIFRERYVKEYLNEGVKLNSTMRCKLTYKL